MVGKTDEEPDFTAEQSQKHLSPRNMVVLCRSILIEGDMAMRAMMIRFTPQERSWIQAYADFMGKSFSEVVRESVLERIEDAVDLLAYEEALAEDDGTTYSMEETMRMAATDSGVKSRSRSDTEKSTNPTF